MKLNDCLVERVEIESRLAHAVKRRFQQKRESWRKGYYVTLLIKPYIEGGQEEYGRKSCEIL